MILVELMEDQDERGAVNPLIVQSFLHDLSHRAWVAIELSDRVKRARRVEVAEDEKGAA